MVQLCNKQKSQMRSRRTTRALGATMPGRHAQSEEENLNPISCETCRQRKCKCDRRLPFCSQCAGEPSKCIYPESGKRGLPLGYLNQLEQRLTETESALYGALMSLRSLGQSTTAPTSAKADAAPKQKAARMAEWSQLPLKDRPDMERWLTAMSDQFTNEPPRGMAPDSSEDASIISMGASHDKLSSLGPEPPSGGGSSAWQPMDSRVDSGSPYDAHRSHPGMMASPIYFGHQVAAGTEVLPNSTASNSQGEMIIDDDAVSDSVDANAFGRAEVRTGRSSKAEELSHTNSSIYF